MGVGGGLAGKPRGMQQRQGSRQRQNPGCEVSGISEGALEGNARGVGGTRCSHPAVRDTSVGAPATAAGRRGVRSSLVTALGHRACQTQRGASLPRRPQTSLPRSRAGLWRFGSRSSSMASSAAGPARCPLDVGSAGLPIFYSSPGRSRLSSTLRVDRVERGTTEAPVEVPPGLLPGAVRGKSTRAMCPSTRWQHQ